MPGSNVEVKTNGKQSRGYLSIPASGEGPGVIVIQEWWGLVGHITHVADRFADAGYVALAPDLYHGKSTGSPDEAEKLMMAMNIEEAEKDLRGAVEFLAGHSATRGDKVGVVGFCMGGQLALFAASKNRRVGACVDFYGIHPSVKPDFSQISAPVLGLFAEKDDFVTPEVVSELEAQLKAAGVSVDFHTYLGTDHAFFNDDRSEVYDAEAANDAWNRVMDLFGKHLKSA
jgi:carboxymethylenebutenolidase